MDYDTETSRLLTKDQQVDVSNNIAKLEEYGYVFLDDWNVYCENDTVYCENMTEHYLVTMIMPPGTEATVEFVKPNFSQKYLVTTSEFLPLMKAYTGSYRNAIWI